MIVLKRVNGGQRIRLPEKHFLRMYPDLVLVLIQERGIPVKKTKGRVMYECLRKGEELPPHTLNYFLRCLRMALQAAPAHVEIEGELYQVEYQGEKKSCAGSSKPSSSSS